MPDDPSVIPPGGSGSEERSGAVRPLRVVEWRRRADVFTRPKLPCLAPYHAMNLSAGCPNECCYCYAQSYDHHPGWGTVAFYSNMLVRLRDEFPRMRNKPTLVYFSTASEPFLPVERILDDLYEIMFFLLEQGVSLLISTKGIIPRRFVETFDNHRDKVHVQVGLTTMDDSIRQVLEPNAASVSERVGNLKRLLSHGVSCEARLDPLVPGLTDGDLSLDALFYELSRIGLRQAAASFLFLRWGIRPKRDLSWGEWSFRDMRRLYTHKVTGYCGGGTIWLPPTEYRRGKFADLKTISHGHGVRVHLCGCKNEDLTTQCCHPLPKRPEAETERRTLL